MTGISERFLFRGYGLDWDDADEMRWLISGTREATTSPVALPANTGNGRIDHAGVSGNRVGFPAAPGDVLTPRSLGAALILGSKTR